MNSSTLRVGREYGLMNEQIRNLGTLNSEFIGVAVKAGYTKQEAESFIVAKSEPIRLRFEGPNRNGEGKDMLSLHTVPKGSRRARLERRFRKFVAESDLGARDIDMLLIMAGTLYHYKTLKPRN